MQKFETLCIDRETEMEMVLCCCTYKEACQFIETENKYNRFGKFMGILSIPHYRTEIRFEQATFLYDEERGLLLKKDI